MGQFTHNKPREECLKILEKSFDNEGLNMLAALAQKPNSCAKLKKKYLIIKAFM